MTLFFIIGIKMTFRMKTRVANFQGPRGNRRVKKGPGPRGIKFYSIVFVATLDEKRIM